MAERGRDQHDHARTLAVGGRIRERRLAAGLTQEDLAEKANVHRAVVGFIERGEREPGISLVWRMADGLGLTPAELLDGLHVPRSRRVPR